MENPQALFTPHFFAAEHGRVHYVDEGAGNPIVFVHGNPSGSFEFRECVRALSATHRCIAPDHLGFGGSDKPGDFDYLPRSHARNLAALIESLGLANITFVFSDWGGPIAMSFAVGNPDKVKALLVTNSWCWSVEKDPYYQLFSGFMGGPLGRFLIKRFNFFARTMVPALFGDKSRLTPEVRRLYLDPLANPEDRKGNWTFPRQIIQAGGWLAGIEAGAGVLRGKRAAICWGEKDIAFRKKELDRWKNLFPGAEVETLPDCGHFVCEERPDAVIQALRKLEE